MSAACYRHPNREAPYYCQKDGNYMCQDCACCHSPRIYCQHRTACVIDLLTKQGELSRRPKKTNRSAELPCGGAGGSAEMEKETGFPSKPPPS